MRRAPDDQRAARLHHEIGRTHEASLGDPETGLKHYKLALAKSPDYLPALRAARRLTMAGRTHQDAVQLFDSEIRLEQNAQRKAYLYLAKGRLLEDHTGQGQAARECYAQAATLDPTNLSVLGAVMQAELAADSWEGLSGALERAAAAIGQEGPHRAALVAMRARIQETRLNAPRDATELFEYALRMDPRAGGALQALKRLLLEQERWQELIAVLRREYEQSEDPEVKTMAMYRIGRIFAERLGDREQATKAMVQAAGISPKDPLVLDELARLYEAANDPASLAVILELLVVTIEATTRRLSLLHRLAQLHSDRLENPGAAIQWHEAALQIDPTYVPALRALSKLYTQKGAWPELVHMYQEEAKASKDTERRATAHARIAELLERHLEQSEEAAEHHALALGLVPGLEASFKALTRLYATSGKYRELVELYEREVDRAKQPDVATTYLLKIGNIFEDALREPAEAVGAYRRVLKRDPKHLGAIHALQRAATSANQHQPLVEALELEVEQIVDETQIVELLHRAGQVLDEELDRPDAALVRYTRVLDINPTHRPCLASLGRLHHRLGRWSDLLEIFGQELEIESDKSKRVRMLMRMAEISEQELGDQSRAIGYYREALELDPGSIPVLHALAHRLHERKDWTGLLEVLETELRGLDSPDSVASVAFQLGAVLEQHLGKLDQAVEAYQRSIQASPRYRPALDALARIHAKQQAWPELVDLLKSEAGQLRDPILAIEALLRSGEILSDHLGRNKVAIQPYEAIRRSVPGHLSALLSLEPLYRKTQNWQQLVELYRSQAETFTDSKARAAALVEVGRLISTHGLADDESAREAYLAALEHHPSHQLALEALEAVALRLRDRTLLTEVDTRYIASGGDSVAALDHHIRLGEALEELRPDRAAEAYLATIEADGGSLTAIRGLARLAEQSSDPSAMAYALRAEANWTTSPDGSADLLVRAARIACSSLEDPRAAAADLEMALDRCPQHTVAAEELADLLREHGEVDRLLATLTRAANAMDDAARRAELWRDIALLQADDKNNIHAGIAALERVTRSEPDHVPTLSELAELYGRNGQWRETADTLLRVVDLGPRRGILADIRLRLARVLIEHLDERKQAADQLESLLRIDGNNREGLGLLLEIHARDGDFKAASAVGRRLLRTAEATPDRVTALVTVGRIQLRAGERPAAAETLHEAVVLAGPTSPAATEYKALLGTDEPWERYVEALQLHRRQIDAGSVDAELHPAFLELAQVQHEHLNDPDAAFATLREALSVRGHVAELHVALGERLRATGRHAESVEAFQTFVANHPDQPEAWRGLARTLGAMGRTADASLSLAPLVVLGEASDVERNRAAQHQVRPGLARQNSFTRESLHTISAGPSVQGHVENMLITLREALTKLYPVDFDGYQVNPRDKLAARDEHPIRALCDRVAPAFGLERFDVYVHQRRVPDVIIELSNPAVVMVPAFMLKLPEPQQVFLVGRALSYLARGVHPVAKLGWERTAQLVTAAARGASPSFGRGTYDDSVLDEERKRLVKASSRRSRKALDEIAEALVSAPRLNMEEVAQSFVLTANRAGVLLAGDLPAAVDIIRQLDRNLIDIRGAGLVQASGVIADLFRFWSSNSAFDFRRRAGVA